MDRAFAESQRHLASIPLRLGPIDGFIDAGLSGIDAAPAIPTTRQTASNAVRAAANDVAFIDLPFAGVGSCSGDPAPRL